MPMAETIRKHTDDIEAMMVEHCAKIAEMHLRPERGELDRGYNRAVRDIAAKIRELNQ